MCRSVELFAPKCHFFGGDAQLRGTSRKTKNSQHAEATDESPASSQQLLQLYIQPPSLLPSRLCVAETSRFPQYPKLRRVLRRRFDGDDEVGGVPCGRGNKNKKPKSQYERKGREEPLWLRKAALPFPFWKSHQQLLHVAEVAGWEASVGPWAVGNVEGGKGGGKLEVVGKMILEKSCWASSNDGDHAKRNRRKCP